MKTKSYFLKKIYNLKEEKKVLYYFHASSLKGRETRKLHQTCNSKNISLVFLPSAFKFSYSSESHGPSMICVISKNLNYPDTSFIKENLLTNLVFVNKYKLHNFKDSNSESFQNHNQKFVSLLKSINQDNCSSSEAKL